MAGAIADRAGRILVTRRPDHVHQGGLWEFPGGKLEPDESPEQGLARELDEELGVQVRSSRPLIRVQHQYGDRHVLLDVCRVDAYLGVPAGREGQPLAWMEPEAMDPAAFPAADRPVISALRLPQRLLITGPDPRCSDTFLLRLARALDAGIRLVQLRAHALDDRAYAALAEAVHALCEERGARLLLNRAPRRVSVVPRHGLHLAARTLLDLEERPGAPTELVGASCHDAVELERAAWLGLDYALLSPVKPTASHPHAVPLGWRGFAELVEPARLPVYALGGLLPSDLDAAIQWGAQGVAGIRAFWPHG